VKAVVAAGDADQTSVAERLGIKPEMVVQEIGWDDDVDEDVRSAIEEQIGGDILDEDADEVIDVVLLWWRENDGDLGDALIDARGPLEETGVIWVLTPKTGQPGHVEPSEIAEAVPAVGLAQTANMSIGPNWIGTRLVSPKSKSKQR
jgi:DNA-binding transcriptional regulator YdaS (Cro superfamily)